MEKGKSIPGIQKLIEAERKARELPYQPGGLGELLTQARNSLSGEVKLSQSDLKNPDVGHLIHPVDRTYLHEGSTVTLDRLARRTVLPTHQNVYSAK